MSSSDDEELLQALCCKRKRGRWWMQEINEKRECLGEYRRLCVELQSHEDLRTFSINFSVNSSAIPYCPPGRFVSKTQTSAARRDLDWSATSVRLLFYWDDAILHNTVRKPARHGHRSLPAAAVRVLCGRTVRPRGHAHDKISKPIVNVPEGKGSPLAQFSQQLHALPYSED